MRSITICVLICVLCPLVGMAASDHTSYSFDKSFDRIENCFQRYSDTVSSLWLTYSNRMAIGRPFMVDSPFPDDEEITELLPFEFNANFPSGKRSEYLYAAGLWVGGVKGQDTLVSHAFDYVAPIPELNPPLCPEGEIRTWSEWADIEHAFVAYDTIILGDTLFRCQVGDCCDWYPLGIKVSAHSYTWESPPYDHSVIVVYTITNIDTTAIADGWVGIYSDCDIGAGETAAGDDISGYMAGAIDSTGAWVDLHIGYSCDMDGDPGNYGFTTTSPRGAFGIQILGLSTPDYDVSFNWWVKNRDGSFDFAPRKDEPVLRDLGGSMAIAYGDSNKYYVMSNQEIDYDQITAGLNHQNSGWLPPGDSGATIARGHDTRFVISAGPFDLPPDDSVTFTVAYLAGNNVIDNPYIPMWFDPSSPLSVADYLELLDLRQLKQAALAAMAVFKNGLQLPPPGPPRQFRMSAYDTVSAQLSWRPVEAVDVAGYQLLQQSERGEWEIVGQADAADTTAVFSGLDPRTTYHFAVASIDSGGAVGKPTPAIELRPNRPHAPATVVGISDRVFAGLDWSRSIDDDVYYYHVYRITDNTGDTVYLGETWDSTWVDLSVVAGTSYHYYVTSIDRVLDESIPSEPVWLVPLPLLSGILAVNANPGAITSNLIFDMDFVDSLFTRALDGLRYTRRRVDNNNHLTLNTLSQYSLVIISAENLGGTLPADLAEILPPYMANGGRVIFILRHVAADGSPEAESYVVDFRPHSFFSSYLFIDSSYIGPLKIRPGYQLAGDLIGAQPEDPIVPSLVWDSVRANQFGYAVPDGLPYCGAIWPRSPAEIVYRYRSFDPDSVTHGRVNGIRYKGEHYQFYLLNFPLSLMKLDSAAVMLRSAVFDLEGDFICGDVSGDLRFDIGDVVMYLRYLYGDSEPPNLTDAGDVNCDSNYDLIDVVTLINFFVGRILAPPCCQ